MSSRPPVTLLERLSDVDITSPADGEGLIFNAGLVKWTNVAIPGGTLETLSDVLIGTPADGQLLVYSSASGKWINYGPLSFTDITGNLAVTQLAGGSGADATTYFRGDNTWGAPATGAIPSTTTLLVGDGGGNAAASFFAPALGGYQVYRSAATEIPLAVQNSNSAGSASLLVGTDLSARTLALTAWGQTATPGMAIAAANDVAASAEYGNLLLVTGGGAIKGSNNLGTSERWRFGNGLSVGTTIDKGPGTVNVNDGFYVKGNKVGGVAVVTTTVDQTSTSETAHISYTVPANSVIVGTTFRISTWGNIDNPAGAITYTPRIRWGGTGGVQLKSGPAFTSPATALNDADFVVAARVTIRAIGASGTAMCDMHVAEHTSAGLNKYTSDFGTSGATPISFVDTTVNKDICLTWTLSSPSGTPHIRTFGGVIEIVEQ